MNYKISVKEFIAEAKADNINYCDFYSRVREEAKRLNRKYGFFQCLADIHDMSKDEIKPRLYGLPISVKDNICTKNLQSSAGSRILTGYLPPFDATAVRRIKENSGIIIGKTNQDEFGFGTFSTNCAFAVPKNPLDPTRSCGGSSGGAAGFVAACDYPNIALAESTGGSISCPACFCGVVGLTPTYGLVSRYGLIDYASSLDKIGAIGKSVYDVALMLSVIAGHDDRDFTSLESRYHDCTKCLSIDEREIKKTRIGVPIEYFHGIDKRIEKHVWNALHKLEGLGASYKEISLPNTRYALASYYIIATAEASTNLAKFCGMRYGLHAELRGGFNEYFSAVRSNGFGEETKRRIVLGTFARMRGYREQYYLKAMRVRTMIIQEFKRAFKRFDALFAPTMPILPPRFKDIKLLSPIQQYQMDMLTVPANLAGIPMISLPCGKVGKLPVGLHVLGNHLQEEKILKIAHSFEMLERKR